MASWVLTLPGEVILGDISEASGSEALLKYYQNWLVSLLSALLKAGTSLEGSSSRHSPFSRQSPSFFSLGNSEKNKQK